MKYKVGVDGGATKTECILVDEAGVVVARHLAPGCNPNVIGAEAARPMATEALGRIHAAIPGGGDGARVSATLLCMAGPLEFWRQFADGLADFGRAMAVDDSLPVLELATGGGPGIVLHSGTGSFVAARGPGTADRGAPPPFAGVHYAGGLGWRFGDEGSAYDLGRRAVARALLELQGWEEESGLGGLLRRHTGLGDAASITRHLYAVPSPNTHVAALASGVLELAAAGDAAALEVAVGSAAALLGLAVRVSGMLFPNGAPGAGLSGPILTHPVVMPELIRRAPFLLRAVAGQPIDGVRALLAGIR
jgi:N-acetylglucosamine kinase-like BadF-type ATPase